MIDSSSQLNYRGFKRKVYRFYKYIEVNKPKSYLWLHIIATFVYIFTYCINTIPSVHSTKLFAFTILITDLILSIFFFGEYLLCLYVAKSKLLFAIYPRNILDLLTTLPLFIEMVFITFSYKSIVPMQYIRLLKVFRVLELYRYGQTSISVKIVIKALQRSLNQITAALISMFVLMVMSSSVMFLVENSLYKQDEMTWYRMEDGKLAKSPFQSVPGTFYWAIVTLTTTGFGDQYPVTTLGKLVAGVTMIFGVAVIAIPTSIIGANLSYEWNNKIKYNYYSKKEKFDPMEPYYFGSSEAITQNQTHNLHQAQDQTQDQSSSKVSHRSNSVSASKRSFHHQDSTSLNEIKAMIISLENQIKTLSQPNKHDP